MEKESSLTIIAKINANNAAFEADGKKYRETGEGGDMQNPMFENQKLLNILMDRADHDATAFNYMKKEMKARP